MTFHRELLWGGETKVYSNGPGHMIKMAAMPIYGKNIKKNFFKVTFYRELLWGGETKVYSNGPGHMIKMAAMPIYGKNIKKNSSPEPKGRWPWILVCIMGARVLPSLFKWRPWIDSDLFYGKVKFGPLCFCMGKRYKNGFFRNRCRLWYETSNRWPKWQEVSVDIKTLSHGDCMPSAQRLYKCIKSWKNGIKSDFKEISLKLATNG